MPVLQLVWRAVPIAAAAVLVLLYGHILRPIWYDEFVYYVLGSYPDLGQAWAAFQETAAGENQGQTGAYQVALGVFLGTFGGHVVSLRILSLVATIVFLASALLFLRKKGLRTFGLVAFLALVAGSPQFMYYSVEARVYLPLAAACSFVLLMYSLPAEQKRQPWARVLTWVAVLALAVVHPYAAIYLPLIVTFTYVDDSLEQRHRLSIKAWLDWAGWPRMAVATLIYLVLGSQTWLRGTAEFPGDSWETLTRPLWLEILHEHLTPVLTTGVSLVMWGVLITCATALLFWKLGVRVTISSLRGPLLLISFSLVGSGLIVALSVSQGFWILSRQWIASIGLTLIGFAWLLWSMWSRLREIRPWVATTFGSVAAIILVSVVTPIAAWQWSNQINAYSSFPVSVDGDYSRRELQSRLAIGDNPSVKDWIRFAHRNSIEGGEVWTEFQEYYGRRERQEFTVVTDPSELRIN